MRVYVLVAGGLVNSCVCLRRGGGAYHSLRWARIAD